MLNTDVLDSINFSIEETSDSTDNTLDIILLGKDIRMNRDE